jgi:hypothetical protein
MAYLANNDQETVVGVDGIHEALDGFTAAW